MNDFSEFFKSTTSSKTAAAGFTPRRWQTDLASKDAMSDLLIRIPTGEGKTIGVLSAWLFHRIEMDNKSWPTRLIWCLPMRALVEQTCNEATRLLENLGWQKEVSVHQLLGGITAQRWYQEPDKPAILVGTQDMLLSRALNRGYGMGRAAWPRAFGLINSDCLWVMDEVQLMGVGLATSGQIQSFWHRDNQIDAQVRVGRPRATWWMSATLQPDWLRTPETGSLVDQISQNVVQVPADARSGGQWEASKPITRIEIESKPENQGQMILDQHREQAAHDDYGRQTLVVVNTVKLARQLFENLQKAIAKDNPTDVEARLVHSRFRPAERKTWIDDFLSRDTLKPDTNRIIVATQVIEAGIDISATCLITELAPWPSLVQRFGRAARYGGNAQILVLDQRHTDDKKSLPYLVAELDAARAAIDQLNDVSIGSLEDFEAALTKEELALLYPYQPLHVLLQEEFTELFDTSPDLSGADVDVSRFIREGEDRDVKVFWRAWAEQRPESHLQPLRDELCSVSLGDAAKWLKKDHLKKKAWTWDYLDGIWVRADADRLKPGQNIIVDPVVGGYDDLLGFTGATPKKKDGPVSEVPLPESALDSNMGERSELSDDSSSINVWKTIATHSQEAAELGRALASKVGLSPKLIGITSLALQLHDWGKAHPSFANGTYRVAPKRADLAKAPDKAWRKKNFYQTESHGPRRGFRHELASCLATLELLRLVNPNHPAILGRYSSLLESCDMTADLPDQTLESTDLAESLNGLTENEFNLLLFLIAGHHGKVRVSMQASPIDQDFPFEDPSFAGTGLPIRGVREGDVVPAIVLPTNNGFVDAPEISLSLAPAAMGLSVRYGASWSERINALIQSYGTFTLGLLESIVRAADGQASNDQRDPGNQPDVRLDGIKLEIPDLDNFADPDDADVMPSADENFENLSDSTSEVANA